MQHLEDAVVNAGWPQLGWHCNQEGAVLSNRSSVDEACYRQVFGRLHAEISAIGTMEQVREQETRVRWLLESVPPTPSDGAVSP
jgi:hypothetical protein